MDPTNANSADSEARNEATDMERACRCRYWEWEEGCVRCEALYEYDNAWMTRKIKDLSRKECFAARQPRVELVLDEYQET